MNWYFRNIHLQRQRQFPLFTSHLAILSIVILTILALLFLNATGAHREDELELLLPPADEDVEGAAQDNPDLISYIKQLHLQAPVGGSYKLIKPEVEDPSQNGQGKMIAKIFKEKKGGTFIEAGAYNGEELSNTLYLERELGWTGLLVEPDPWNYWSLRKRSRNSYSIQCCLSPFPYPREVTFRQSDTMGRILDPSEGKSKGIFTRVKCFPLYSLMIARNLQKLDLLSLDVEGKELEVLKTLPWNKVEISAILVECSHIPDGKIFLRKYLEKKGYSLYSTVGEDFLFINKAMVNDIINS